MKKETSGNQKNSMKSNKLKAQVIIKIPSKLTLIFLKEDLLLQTKTQLIKISKHFFQIKMNVSKAK